MKHHFRSVHWPALWTFGLSIGTGSTLMLMSRIETVQATPQTIPAYNPAVSLAPLVDALSPAVVSIDISIESHSDPVAQLFNLNGPIQAGQGSGILISEDGYLLTNNHVVDGADTLKIRLADDTEYVGTLIGVDDSIDIALVKISSEKPLPYVKLGDSDSVRVGDWVVAIGSPFGLAQTVTTGIISAKERNLGSGPYDGYLQTDASINPGNSGGPLFNLQGEVIAINTAINPHAQGIGFSVPINKITTVLEDLKEKGHPSRGWLGLGLKSDEHTPAIIASITPDSPAESVGLQVGDFILSVDSVEVTDLSQLIQTIGNQRAGDVVELTIQRDNGVQTVQITLGERPSERSLALGSQSSHNYPDTYGLKLYEVQVRSNGKKIQGLLIHEIIPKSPFSDKLQPEDVLLSLNNQETRHIEDFQNIMKRISTTPNQNMVAKIYRRNRILEIEFD